MAYDPIKLAENVRRVVVKGDKRKYYRVSRPGRWYGGIATSDCCGCNLKCIFCWSNRPRDDPGNIGRFYSPEEIFENLIECAKRNNYRRIRVSGNEPTLGGEHLLKLLELVEKTGYLFILETNGTLINDRYAKALSRFKNLHVRVSLKGTNPEEFSLLTGASRGAFELQLNALRYLINYKVRCHPAVMLSFSKEESLLRLREKLKRISPSLSENLEEEYVFLYPHVRERLREAGVSPRIAYEPNRIPSRLV